jgi:hypothetical protein
MPVASSKDLRTRVIADWEANQESHHQLARNKSKFELCSRGTPLVASDGTRGTTYVEQLYNRKFRQLIWIWYKASLKLR